MIFKILVTEFTEKSDRDRHGEEAEVVKHGNETCYKKALL